MKSLLAVLLLVVGLNVHAAETKAETKLNELNCEAVDTSSQIYISLRDVRFLPDSATARHFSMTIVVDGGSDYDIIPNKSGGSVEGKDLKSTPYKGRKYVNHVKFQLASSEMNWAGSFEPETADLIVSPEYTVAKTIPQQNDWDKTWTWDVEVRKHSAVLATHFDDHHGDYIQLNCYSSAHVNDSKGRK